MKDYYRRASDRILQPAQIIDFNLDKERVVLRRFLRKDSIDDAARPNQLVVTEETFEKGATDVVRKCYVRLFDAATIAEGLPLPYSRNGAGDRFFICSQEDPAENGESTAASDGQSPALPSLEPMWVFVGDTPPRKLRGLGIFCGGGNFDRGLAEGYSVDFKYAVDYAPLAIHSYRANVSPEEEVACFCGSVDDYLAQAMAGSERGDIARPSDVDFISGGSPCPGVSMLQKDKLSGTSLRNASKVASYLSYVDFYVPAYCILENVVSMTSNAGAKKDENVFSQILATLVAMGYQVQQFLIDAWSFGSSQQRTRIVVVASAPGLEPLARPPSTHAHCSIKSFVGRSLAKSSNGEYSGNRRNEFTPFPHVSVGASTDGLPDIEDGQPGICPAFPDHRTPKEENAVARSKIAAVPIRYNSTDSEWVMSKPLSLLKAGQDGKLNGEPLVWYHKKIASLRGAKTSNSYSRIRADGLFPTVTTSMSIGYNQSGQSLHWTQNRSATLQEYRRAQGFLDHEVILGSPDEQLKIIGNSVDRSVAFALGLALRQAWFNSNKDVRDRVLRASQQVDQIYNSQEDAEDDAAAGAALTPSDEDELAIPESTPLPRSSQRRSLLSSRNLSHQRNEEFSVAARLETNATPCAGSVSSLPLRGSSRSRGTAIDLTKDEDIIVDATSSTLHDPQPNLLNGSLVRRVPGKRWRVVQHVIIDDSEDELALK